MYKTTLVVQFKVYSVLNRFTFVPDSATEEMSMPDFCDMQPRTEKMAKPDIKLVPLFNKQRQKESLQIRNNALRHYFFLGNTGLTDTLKLKGKIMGDGCK